MKTRLILGFAIAILVIGCSKNDDSEKSTITQEEASINAKIDVASDDVASIVDSEFSATLENGEMGRLTNLSQQFLPSCATVSRVPDFGTIPTVGQLVTKTIDFGTTGCPLANGNVLKGKIVITFTYNPGVTTHTITYQFLDFYHNAVKINGNKTFTRTYTPPTQSTSAHLVVVMNMDLTATFPDGRVFTRVGTRTRDMVAGIETPFVYLDDKYNVTGNWTTTFPNTTVQTSTITSPLLVQMSCIATNKPLLVKGVITFVRNNNTATLDYGDGECDNTAVFTINGNSYTIIFGN